MVVGSRVKRGALVVAVASVMMTGGLPSLVSAAPAAAGLLEPYGLTNSGDTNAKTDRMLTWLAAENTYTNPYFKLAPVGQDVNAAPATSNSCLRYPLLEQMATYDAFACMMLRLTPGTTYNYILGANAGTTVVESPVYQFTTASATAATDDTGFTFIDVADTYGVAGTYQKNWANTLDAALANNPSARFVAANGNLTASSDMIQFNYWLGATGERLTGVGFNPVLGNLQALQSAQSVWEGVFPRESLVDSPFNLLQEGALEYAQVYGNALMLYINTNMSTPDQIAKTTAWAKTVVQEYGKNPDGTDRFIIALQGQTPYGAAERGASALEKAYHDLGVDLVFGGQDGIYTRSLPIQWSASAGTGVWDRAKVGLKTINSDTDGL
ncbi:MAG: hypothetical protein LBI33_01830, partial [Propionibacteriaceae bacterium]|nr:hypothetical protein [Propionibacteriaceae bacterium]